MSSPVQRSEQPRRSFRRAFAGPWTALGRPFVWVLIASIAVPGGGADGQQASVPPGPHYAAGALQRFLLGDGRRDLWTTPVRAEPLDLAGFAGGLSVIRAGGGNQTRTLHLQGADGRRYIFRSVDKFVEQVLPPDLTDTFVHDLVQDHISALHPTGALAVPPLIGAAGVLHVVPRLVVMPDDPALGDERAAFAGMLGTIEERPGEGEDGTPGFAGSHNVVGMERLLERIVEDPAQRPAEREYLAARLIDFLIGDTDRGTDQWRWASEPQPDGTLLWRPIPRDRDWAFLRSDGALTPVAQALFPKLVAFGHDYPSISALTFSSIHLDRRLLEGLASSTWDSVALALQAAVTDDVIDDAVRRLPPEHAALDAVRLAAALRARRDALHDVARQFYHHLAGTVDVHGTDVADVADITFLPDGSVEVRLSSPAGQQLASTDTRFGESRSRAPYYVRRFVPQESGEVRIHLLAGDDRALIRGAAASPIRVRVLGGAGDDTLIDETTSPGTRVGLYDAEGTNTLVAGAGTRIDTRPFAVPGDPDDWLARKVTRSRFRDWGDGRSIMPTLDLGDEVGLVIGARLTTTRYAFRRTPYAQRRWLEARYAPATGGFGLEAGAHWTRENSPWSARLTVGGEQFDALRFYGFGNDVARATSGGAPRVLQSRVHITPAIELQLTPAAHAALGLSARHIDPRPAPGSTLVHSGAFGDDAFGTAGAWAEAHVEPSAGEDRRTAFGATASASVHPPVWDAADWFGRAHLEATTHFRIGPTLALRGGATRAWGTFPVQDAAFVGGRHTLRGFRSNRFAGDAALYGTAELRQKLGRARLLLRGDVQAHAFVDIGRVYMDGASPGGWHAGTGAGLAFTTLGTTFSASYAHGEEHRVYLRLGQPW
jgi:hypothetical protein